MATTLTLAFSGDAPPRFPDRCVGCRGARHTESTLAVSRVISTANGNQREITRRFQVPHCAACARSTKAVFLAGFLPFALGFFVAGALGLAAGFYGGHVTGVDEARMRSGDTPYSFVLAGAAGLLAGIAGGFVFELVGRVLLLPFYGRALWRAPLLVPSFFTDVDYVAGLKAQPNADASRVTLTFEHDDVALAFASLNGG